MLSCPAIHTEAVPLAARSRVMHLAGRTARSIKRKDRGPDIVDRMTYATDLGYRQRILQVQLFIQEHLEEDLPLDRLARVAHFSPYHFHRVFKALVGEGVHEYVRRLRLEAAAVTLKTTEHPIIQIALGAGYETHEAFTRAFRQMFGVSPSQFRAGEHPLYIPNKESAMTAEAIARDVRIETLPPRRIAFIRHVGPYDTAGPTFGRLMAWAGQRSLFGPGTLVLGVCHDDPDVTQPRRSASTAASPWTTEWPPGVRWACRRWRAGSMPSSRTAARTPGWGRRTAGCTGYGCRPAGGSRAMPRPSRSTATRPRRRRPKTC